jgi:hypothetical protein
LESGCFGGNPKTRHRSQVARVALVTPMHGMRSEKAPGPTRQEAKTSHWTSRFDCHLIAIPGWRRWNESGRGAGPKFPGRKTHPKQSLFSVNSFLPLECGCASWNWQRGRCRTLRGGNGSRHSRCGFRVLHKPILGTADSEHWRCIGVRSFLFEIPQESMNKARQHLYGAIAQTQFALDLRSASPIAAARQWQEGVTKRQSASRLLSRPCAAVRLLGKLPGSRRFTAPYQ